MRKHRIEMGVHRRKGKVKHLSTGWMLVQGERRMHLEQITAQMYSLPSSICWLLSLAFNRCLY
jgi:hypothetical protein